MGHRITNPLIHIGYHKTATTWFQRRLFTRDNAVFEPLSRKDKGYSSVALYFTHDEEHYLLSPFVNNDELVQKEVQDLVEMHPALCTQIPVISHERLSGNPHSSGFDACAIASRLKQSFPDARILISIREQKDFLLSNYFQYLSVGGTRNLARYLSYEYDGKLPGFSPSHILYVPLIKEYHRLFGKENVLIMPYELFRKTPKNYIKNLSDFVGKHIEVPDDEFRVTVNKNRYQYLRYYLRILNIFKYKSSLNGYSPLSNRFTSKLAFLLQKLIMIVFPRRLNRQLTRKLKVEIENWTGDRYVATNKELSDLIGFDLSQYGYH